MRSLSILATVATTAILSAQGANTAPRPAPQWALSLFDVTTATVQDLHMPQARETFRFQVNLGGSVETIEIEPNDVRAPNFQLLVDDGTTITQAPTPAPITWRGTVLGKPTAVVAASIVDRRLEAVISLASDQPHWGIQSLNAVDANSRVAEHIVYSVADSITRNTTCGVGNELPVAGGQGGGIDMLEVAEIALDCDLEYYQRNGSNVNNVQNTATTLINACDVIYRRDVDITYTITTILVRTSRTYNNTDMRQLLPEFRSRWNAQHRNIQRDVATLLTGKGSFSGIVGIAYLGVICDLNNAYNVNKAFSSLGTNTGLVCHELGHNWNAPHCDGANPCNIMCAGLGGCNRNLSSFGNSSIGVITSFKNSRGCLDPAVQRPTLSSINPGTLNVFPSQTVTLTGNNLNGITAVNVGGVTVNQISVQSNTQATFQSPVPTSLGAVNVTVTNAAGTSNPVSVQYQPANPPVHAAPPFGFSNSTIDFVVAGDPNDNWFLIAAFNDPTTVQFMGFDILVNNLILVQGQLNSIGFSPVPFPVPNVSLQGVSMDTQAILLDENTSALNHVTTILNTTFFF